MSDAIFVYIISILLSFITAAVCTVLFSWGFSRRCTKLEWALGDLQQRLSTFKGRDMAETRWKKDKEFNEEMAQVLRAEPARTRRYDNDPLV